MTKPDNALSLAPDPGIWAEWYGDVASTGGQAMKAGNPWVRSRAARKREVCPREKARIQVTCENPLAPQWTIPWSGPPLTSVPSAAFFFLSDTQYLYICMVNYGN